MAGITSSKNGQVITLPPGTHGPVIVKHQDVEIRGAGIGETIIDAARAAEGIRGQNGAHGLEIHGLTIRNAGKGIRVTMADGVKIHGVHVHDTGAEGVNTGICSDLLLEDLEIWDTAANWVLPSDRGRDFYADKAHGVYIGTNFARATLRRVKTRDTSGMGIHVNGTVGEGWAREVVIEDCRLERALLGKNVGAPALQFCATDGAIVRRTYIGESNGGVTLHGEGDPRWAARNVTLEDCAIAQAEGRFALNVMDRAALDVEGASLIIGRVTGTVRYDPAVRVFASLTDEARALLAAWKEPGAAPPPPPAVDAEALRAQVAELLAERDSLRLEVGRLAARIRAAQEALAG